MSDRPLLAGPFLVVGCGAAGASAACALAAAARPAAVRVWDEHDGPATRARAALLAAEGIAVELGPWSARLLDVPATPALVVKSPGIAPSCPPVAAALAQGISVIDELDLGRRLHRRPLVAVTGTDGKSTVSALLAAALGGADGPVPVAGNTEFGPPLTRLPAGEGPVVVETSSYQLEFTQAPFAELAVLTNLTTEHLGRHGTMEAYGAAKRRLFLCGGGAVPRAVVNVDAPFGRALARDLRAAGATVAGYGSAAARAEYRVLEARWGVAGADVRLATPHGDVPLRTQLPGGHNAENVAAALAGCDLLALDRAQACAAIEAFPGVPGRWERIHGNQPFDVVVDFAHTPNALRRVLLTARGAVADRPGARVHLVVGSGGGHARDRRAPLGRLASELADRAVVTESNGRGEPRERVIAGILAGATGTRATMEVEPDRRAAIHRALAGASAGDLLIVSGRGIMPRLLTSFADEGPPFDDRVVVREELAKLAGDALAAV